MGNTARTPSRRGSRLVTLKPSWAEYEYGPYERCADTRRLVLEGYLMQRYDPTVGAALALVRQLVVSRLGDYRHSDRACERLVRANLNGLREGRRQMIVALLSCLWAGFAVAVKRWHTDRDGWWLEGLELLHPLTLFPANPVTEPPGIELAASGEVACLRQFAASPGQAPVRFAREEVLYWPFLRELREEVYGRRLTDRARRSWFMRVKLEQFWAVYLEKAAHPIPIFRVPRGMQVGAGGQEVSNSEFYGEFIGSLTAGQGLAIEAEADEHFSFDLLESRLGGDLAYSRAAAYHNAELFKSVLMSPLLLEEPEHGTRAQATTAMEVTIMLVEAIREELGSVLVQDVARPLIQYNLGAREDYGEWDFESLRDEDLEMLSAVHERIARAGAVRLCPADEEAVRERFAAAGFARNEAIAAGGARHAPGAREGARQIEESA